MGYETVAINQTVDDSIFDNEKKKKKKSQDSDAAKNAVPEPLDLTDIKAEFEKKLNILSRITFTFGDVSKVHTLGQSHVLKKYDLYAVVPKTQAAFQFACSQLNADIVTLKSSNLGLKFTRKLYLQAVERGLHFEIQYSDVIRQSTRKYALHYSHLYHIFGKSKVSCILIIHDLHLLLSIKLSLTQVYFYIYRTLLCLAAPQMRHY